MLSCALRARRAARRGARSFASLGAFEARAAAYWTSDRVHWLCNGRNDALRPDKPGVASLLRVMGLLDADGSMGSESLRKYRQVNSMHDSIAHALAAPLSRRSSTPLRLVDLCSGQSYLALLLAFCARERWRRPAQVLAVDADPKRLAASQKRAALLGFGPEVLRFRHSRIEDLARWTTEYADAFGTSAASARGSTSGVAPHGVFALHACDTATDAALAYALHAASEAVLVAPCCQVPKEAT